MVLIKCSECRKEISDKADTYSNCSYTIKYPVPNYINIQHNYDINLNDTYYDGNKKEDFLSTFYIITKIDF